MAIKSPRPVLYGQIHPQYPETPTVEAGQFRAFRAFFLCDCLYSVQPPFYLPTPYPIEKVGLLVCPTVAQMDFGEPINAEMLRR